MKTCQRCGEETDRLYEIGQIDEDEELIKKEVCWDCDHDVCNGGDLFEDTGTILMDRAENNYAFDPINTPKPEWMP